MDEKRLAIAALVWSIGVLCASYLYRLTITDTIYARQAAADRPIHTQAFSQQ